MFNFGFFLALFILAVTVTQDGQAREPCGKVFSDMNKKQFKLINKCTRQLGYKNGFEKSKKAACMMKCVMKDLDLMNDEGYIDTKQFNIHLARQWPAFMVQRINSTFQHCLQLPRPVYDPNDPYCKSFKPLMFCFRRNVVTICQGIDN